MAVLSTLLPTTSLIFAIQTAFAIPGYLYSTERYYDLSGGLTFLAATAYLVARPALRSSPPHARARLLPALSALFSSGTLGPWGWRHLALAAMAAAWSARLSAHLFARIRAQGHDSRFDRLKHSPRFLVAWFFQAVWVSVSLLPAALVAAVPAAAMPPGFRPADAVGLALWAGGMAFEVAADRQKSRWVEARRRKEHDEEFLTRGLWAWCRYPNYFGEVTLWTGAATVAAGVMGRSSVLGALGWGGLGGWARAGAVALPYLCPAFSAFLLLRVSGVPLSQPKYDRKFGDREDYRRWKDNTPMFFPKFW